MQARANPARGARSGPTGLIVAGLGAIAVGAWTALALLIGPSAGVKHHAWQLTSAHVMFGLLPGSAAILAGFVILSAARRIAPAPRSWLVAASLVTVLAGSWVVIAPFTGLFTPPIVPAAAPITPTGAPTPSSSPTHDAKRATEDYVAKRFIPR